MDDRRGHGSPERTAGDEIHVPFSQVPPGAVFVVNLAAYVKLERADVAGEERANSVHMGTGRLHFFEAGYSVACPGALS